MKKILFLLFFIFCCSLTLWQYDVLFQKENDVNQHLIELETKKVNLEKNQTKKETFFFVLCEIIVGIILFFAVNYLFVYYDKNAENITTQNYQVIIKDNFKQALKSVTEEPIKYFIYQNDCSLSTLFKSCCLNILMGLFYQLLLIGLNNFQLNKEVVVNDVKKTLKNIVHNRLIGEYQDIFYFLWQNHYLDKISFFNKNTEDFCYQLQKSNISKTEINHLRELLTIKVVERRKLKSNYLFLSVLMGMSVYFFMSEKGSLMKYFENFVKENYTFLDIWQEIQRQLDLVNARNNLVRYKIYVDNCQDIQEVIQFLEIKQNIYLLAIIFARGYFSKKDNFVAFIFELVTEVIGKFISKKVNNFLFNASDIISEVKDNQLINNLFS